MRGILGTLICHLWTCATRRILNSLLISCLEQNGREAISSFQVIAVTAPTPACWLSRRRSLHLDDYLPGGREIKAVSTCPRNSGCSECSLRQQSHARTSLLQNCLQDMICVRARLHRLRKKAGFRARTTKEHPSGAKARLILWHLPHG